MSVIEKALGSAREDVEDAFGSEARELLDRLDALGLVVMPAVLLRRHWEGEDAIRLENVQLHVPVNWQVYDDLVATVAGAEQRFKATLLAAGAVREAALLQQVNGDRVALIVDRDDDLILHVEVATR